jgi:hypothetical protein
MSSGRKTQGRRKIEMKRMTNDSNMQVTFSKRRTGLFKKASELSTLCGANVALVVFSPGGKVFSFGHPNVDTIIDRYLSRLPSQNNGTMPLIEALHNATVHELNSQLTRFNDELDTEKKHRDDWSHINRMNETQYWWACPIDGMDFNQLQFLKNAFEELKKRIPEHVNRFVNQGAPTQTMPFVVGNDSFSNMYVPQQPNPQQGVMYPEQPFQSNPQGQMFLEQPIQDPNMYVHHQPNPLFLEQTFQNPMSQHNFFNFNNMGGGGGGGGYGPPRFF